MIDEFVSRTIMFESLKKINHSLDCRFEKDADLYINKQDSQEIKNMINGSCWQGINGLYKTNKVSPDILTIEIIKDAWLIRDIKKDGAEYLIEIFNNCEKNIFIKNAEKIINNELYSPLCLKDIINSIYYKNANINICREILDGKVRNFIFNENIRKVCVKRVLDECTSAKILYNNMREYIQKNEIFENSNDFQIYAKDLSESRGETFAKEFGRIIFENRIEDNADFKEEQWYLIFRSLGKVAFDICSEYLEESEVEDQDFSRNLVKYLMFYQLRKPTEEEEKYYLNKIKELFSNYNLRWVFIKSVKSIFNESLKKKVIDYFLEQPNLLEKQKEILLNKSTDSISTENILQDLLSNKLSKGNRTGNLNYLAASFLEKSENVEKLGMMIDYLNNENVQEWYLLMIDQAKKGILKDALLGLFKYLEKNSDRALDKEIKFKIEAKPRKFESCKKIIAEYDFEFFKKVYG